MAVPPPEKSDLSSLSSQQPLVSQLTIEKKKKKEPLFILCWNFKCLELVKVFGQKQAGPKYFPK